jgi:hypothetical protein
MDYITHYWLERKAEALRVALPANMRSNA